MGICTDTVPLASVLLYFALAAAALAALALAAAVRRGAGHLASLTRAGVPVAVVICEVCFLWHVIADRKADEATPFRAIQELLDCSFLSRTDVVLLTGWLLPHASAALLLLLACGREGLLLMARAALRQVTEAAEEEGGAEARGSARTRAKASFQVAFVDMLASGALLFMMAHVPLTQAALRGFSCAAGARSAGGLWEDDQGCGNLALWGPFTLLASLLNVVAPTAALALTVSWAQKRRLRQHGNGSAVANLAGLQCGQAQTLRKQAASALAALVPCEPWLPGQLALDALAVACAELGMASGSEQGRQLGLTCTQAVLFAEVLLLLWPRWLLDARLLSFNSSLRVALLVASHLNEVTGLGATWPWPVAVVAAAIWAARELFRRASSCKAAAALKAAARVLRLRSAWAGEEEDDDEPPRPSDPLVGLAHDLAMGSLFVVLNDPAKFGTMCSGLSHDESTCISVAAELVSERLLGAAAKMQDASAASQQRKSSLELLSAALTRDILSLASVPAASLGADGGGSSDWVAPLPLLAMDDETGVGRKKKSGDGTDADAMLTRKWLLDHFVPASNGPAHMAVDTLPLGASAVTPIQTFEDMIANPPPHFICRSQRRNMRSREGGCVRSSTMNSLYAEDLMRLPNSTASGILTMRSRVGVGTLDGVPRIPHQRWWTDPCQPQGGLESLPPGTISEVGELQRDNSARWSSEADRADRAGSRKGTLEVANMINWKEVVKNSLGPRAARKRTATVSSVGSRGNPAMQGGADSSSDGAGESSDQCKSSSSKPGTALEPIETARVSASAFGSSAPAGCKSSSSKPGTAVEPADTARVSASAFGSSAPARVSASAFGSSAPAGCKSSSSKPGTAAEPPGGAARVSASAFGSSAPGGPPRVPAGLFRSEQRVPANLFGSEQAPALAPRAEQRVPANLFGNEQAPALAPRAGDGPPKELQPIVPREAPAEAAQKIDGLQAAQKIDGLQAAQKIDWLSVCTSSGPNLVQKQKSAPAASSGSAGKRQGKTVRSNSCGSGGAVPGRSSSGASGGTSRSNSSGPCKTLSFFTRKIFGPSEAAAASSGATGSTAASPGDKPAAAAPPAGDSQPKELKPPVLRELHAEARPSEAASPKKVISPQGSVDSMSSQHRSLSSSSSDNPRIFVRPGPSSSSRAPQEGSSSEQPPRYTYGGSASSSDWPDAAGAAAARWAEAASHGGLLPIPLAKQTSGSSGCSLNSGCAEKESGEGPLQSMFRRQAGARLPDPRSGRIRHEDRQDALPTIQSTRSMKLGSPPSTTSDMAHFIPVETMTSPDCAVASASSFPVSKAVSKVSILPEDHSEVSAAMQHWPRQEPMHAWCPHLRVGQVILPEAYRKLLDYAPSTSLLHMLSARCDMASPLPMLEESNVEGLAEGMSPSGAAGRAAGHMRYCCVGSFPGQLAMLAGPQSRRTPKTRPLENTEAGTPAAQRSRMGTFELAPEVASPKGKTGTFEWTSEGSVAAGQGDLHSNNGNLQDVTGIDCPVTPRLQRTKTPSEMSIASSRDTYDLFQSAIHMFGDNCKQDAETNLQKQLEELRAENARLRQESDDLRAKQSCCSAPPEEKAAAVPTGRLTLETPSTDSPGTDPAAEKVTVGYLCPPRPSSQRRISDSSVESGTSAGTAGSVLMASEASSNSEAVSEDPEAKWAKWKARKEAKKSKGGKVKYGDWLKNMADTTT